MFTILMSRATILQFLAVALCAAAAFVSHKLLTKHVTGSSGSTWFEAGCTPGDETGGADCAAVLTSPHSYWPPKKTGEPPGTPHVPVAFLGLVYYSALGVWLIGVGRPSRVRRWLHLLPLACVLCGLAISIYYTFIMYSTLEVWCPWCLLTHILNFLIAVCVILLWPRRAKGVRAAGSSLRGYPRGLKPAARKPMAHEREASSIVQSRQDTVHPSWTRVLGTIGAIAIVSYGNYGQSALLAVRRTRTVLQQCLSAVTRIKTDTTKLVRNWRLAERQEIHVRPDDPIRTGATADRKAIEVIVFSDFRCPSCRRFAALLHERIDPLFAGGLRIVFKHYPLDRQCNPQAGRTLHPNACAAARVAEAARLIGGSRLFWKAHDVLFERQLGESQGKSIDVEAIADELGLDANRLLEEMDSAQVALRIREDAMTAKDCGVRGTPAVFVEGKLVDPLAILEIEFWEQVAEQFAKEIGAPRPDEGNG